jgi:plastocyanin
MNTRTILTIAAALSCVGAMTTPTAVRAPADGKATGHVKFDGKPPEMKPLQVTEDKAKNCCPPGKNVDATDPTLVLSKDGGIANVVVTIEVPGEKMEPSTQTVEIDQKMCHFEPHVRVIGAGGKVVFLNSDQVSHNIHTYANKNDPFNKTVAPGSKEEQTVAKGDKIQVKCDIHDWMSAWVFVSETPHFAVTKEDGSFEITGLKPGKYKVELWHEKLGKAKGEVTIKDDGTSEPLEVKMGEKKKT